MNEISTIKDIMWYLPSVTGQRYNVFPDIYASWEIKDFLCGLVLHHVPSCQMNHDHFMHASVQLDVDNLV